MAAALTITGPIKNSPHESCPAGSPWPDLPPELLGLVLLRIPSHADRVRLRAVCRPWRSGARDQPLPPLLLWIALRDGAFLSLPDGVLHRLPVPADVAHRVIVGGELFLVHGDGSCSLMNPLTGETAPQQIDPDVLWCPTISGWRVRRLHMHNIRKVVVSDRIVAVIRRSDSKVSICARGPQGDADAVKCKLHVDDIELFQGKLYILRRVYLPRNMQHRELSVVDFGANMPPVQCIPATTKDACSTGVHRRYSHLVVSGDRLLMVEREIVFKSICRRPIGTRRLEVFEATGLNGSTPHWSKVDTLMGHALFVSQDCLRSLPVISHCGCTAGAQQDCVYFLSEQNMKSNRRDRTPEEDFLDSGVYNIRDHTLAPLPIEMAPMETAVVSHDGPWCLTWFFLPSNPAT